jgi:hypothetical protein
MKTYNKEEMDKLEKLKRETGLPLMNAKKCLEDYNFNYRSALSDFRSYLNNYKLVNPK